MSRRFVLEDARGRRTVSAADFPLAVGGADGDLRIEALGETVAWLGLDAGDLFLQPVNGDGPGDRSGDRSGDGSGDGHGANRGSRWLEPEQEIDLGGARLRLESDAEGPMLRLLEPGRGKPPKMVPPPRPARTTPAQTPPLTRPRASPAEPAELKSAAGRPIEPIHFEPARADRQAPRRRAAPRLALGSALLLLFAVIAVVAYFLFAARSVELIIEPAPQQVEIEGTWVKAQAAGRHLLLPGRYTVLASKDGYRPLRAPLVVGPEASQSHAFTLEKKPGRLRLSVASGNADLAPDDVDFRLAVDGEPAQLAPGGVLTLEAGPHLLRVEAARHRPAERQIEIEGAGVEQQLELVLEPRWAEVRFESLPAGASLRIDGEAHGTTPATIDLLEGSRVYTLSLAGHTPRRGSLQVVAGRDAKVGPLELRPSDGNLTLTSQPEGASVRVDGAYRGKTPLSLELEPGREHGLRVEKLGHAAAERRVRLEPGASEEMHVQLEAELARVTLAVIPSDAEILLNGEPVDTRELELPAARSHELEVRKDGFLTQKRQIQLLAGHDQKLEIRLDSVAAARERQIRQLGQTAEGQELKLIEPGRFRMGASRRESGRRPNETLREIELTRRFYLSAHEVTNAEFRRFRPAHGSGSAGGHTLDLDDQPVVRVSWQDAAAYCNWLSEKEGLEPAYEKSGEQWVAKAWDERPPSGYRLPTEAEWAWAARFPRGEAEKGLKYAWGDSLPVAEKSVNVADVSAANLVSAHLHDYADGHPVTAPVGAFAPNALGLRQLGGNVAEWVHDVYVVRPAMLGAVERDPQGPQKGELHVIRGASWMHSTITELRLSFRDYGDEPRPDLGFRIARPVP